MARVDAERSRLVLIREKVAAFKKYLKIGGVCRVIEFPTVWPKNSKRDDPSPPWIVTVEQINEWQGDFGNLDVLAEVKKARAWCVANPAKRKTSKGMPRFLVGWFMRAEGTGTMERRVKQRRDVPSDPALWAKADDYARSRR